MLFGFVVRSTLPRAVHFREQSTKVSIATAQVGSNDFFIFQLRNCNVLKTIKLSELKLLALFMALNSHPA